jgi:hypothetical protein
MTGMTITQETFGSVCRNQLSLAIYLREDESAKGVYQCQPQILEPVFHREVVESVRNVPSNIRQLIDRFSQYEKESRLWKTVGGERISIVASSSGGMHGFR